MVVADTFVEVVPAHIVVEEAAVPTEEEILRPREGAEAQAIIPGVIHHLEVAPGTVEVVVHMGTTIRRLIRPGTRPDTMTRTAAGLLSVPVTADQTGKWMTASDLVMRYVYGFGSSGILTRFLTSSFGQKMRRKFGGPHNSVCLQYTVIFNFWMILPSGISHPESQTSRVTIFNLSNVSMANFPITCNNLPNFNRIFCPTLDFLC